MGPWHHFCVKSLPITQKSKEGKETLLPDKLPSIWA